MNICSLYEQKNINLNIISEVATKHVYAMQLTEPWLHGLANHVLSFLL